MRRSEAGTAWGQEEVRIGHPHGRESCRSRGAPYPSRSLAPALVSLLPLLVLRCSTLCLCSISHLGVTSTSPLKLTACIPPLQAQPIECAIHQHGLDSCLPCPACPACLQSKRISTDCPCSRLWWSRPTSQFALLAFCSLPTRRRCPQRCAPPPGRRVIMYDDGMRRVSALCESGHDESDVALHRSPIAGPSACTLGYDTCSAASLGS